MTAAELFANLAIPIIQAPMLGASGPAMALAVTRAGGMGSLAAGALAPKDIAQQIAALKAATDRPFGVNLLIARPATPDPATVIEALERLAQGRTVITIAHRLSTIKNADRIIVLRDGAILEEGNYASLLARRGVFAELIHAQTLGDDAPTG